MIFRKPNLSRIAPPSPLQRIHSRIESYSILRLCVLDASDDDGVLVVLCTESSMQNMIKMSLEKHWPGEIEIFCPTNLMTGSSISDDTVEFAYQNPKKSLRYLN